MIFSFGPFPRRRIEDTPAALTLGGLPNENVPVKCFACALDEVCVFSRALSQKEIRSVTFEAKATHEVQKRSMPFSLWDESKRMADGKWITGGQDKEEYPDDQPRRRFHELGYGSDRIGRSRCRVELQTFESRLCAKTESSDPKAASRTDDRV